MEASLRMVIEELALVFGLRATLETDERAALAALTLQDAQVLALTRVAREALINVAKHAGTSTARVRFSWTKRNRLVVRVIDDGCGFCSRPGEQRHGITSMRRIMDEVHGTLRILTNASVFGTTVLASLPTVVTDSIARRTAAASANVAPSSANCQN